MPSGAGHSLAFFCGRFSFITRFAPALTGRSYYLEARNPSDNETLVDLAGEIGLEREQFASSLDSAATRQKFSDELHQARALGINSFPSLAVRRNGELHHIGLNYLDAEAMLAQIDEI